MTRLGTVRAGIILGPHDYDDRFAYWLRRIARGGEVLAPGGTECWSCSSSTRAISRPGWCARRSDACAEFSMPLGPANR